MDMLFETTRLREGQGRLASGAPFASGQHDLAINAESRSFEDDGVTVSILSVHTLACPLIRAELRGEALVRVLVYYPAETRLGLHAFEVLLRDGAEVQARLGLRQFLRTTLSVEESTANLHDPVLREMYLHEVIRRLSHDIALRRLHPDDDFSVARII